MRLTIGNLVISKQMEMNGAFGSHPCTNAHEIEPGIRDALQCGRGGIQISVLKATQDFDP
jgi:hypothetical protein